MAESKKRIYEEVNYWVDVEKDNRELEKRAMIRALGIVLFWMKFPQFKNDLLECLADAQKIIEEQYEDNK